MGMDTPKMELYIDKKVLMFVALFLFISCENKKITNKISINEHLLPSISIFTIAKTNNGKLIWLIDAKEAFVDEKNNIITVKNGELNLYDNKNYVAKIKFYLAKYDRNTENISLLGKNIISTVENEQIIAYDINYIYKENKIFSEKEIEIYKPNNAVVKGVGFETFDGFQTIRIYKNVISTE